jgi:hypothetical protein
VFGTVRYKAPVSACLRQMPQTLACQSSTANRTAQVTQVHQEALRLDRRTVSKRPPNAHRAAQPDERWHMGALGGRQTQPLAMTPG